MRAFSVVNRHRAEAARSLRVRVQAVTSRRTVSLSGSRRFRHCRASTLNSHSAMFNQLPCLGVYTNASFSINARATCGSNALYSDAPQWVLRLSMTSVIRLASGKSSSTSRRTPSAQATARWSAATSTRRHDSSGTCHYQTSSIQLHSQTAAIDGQKPKKSLIYS